MAKEFEYEIVEKIAIISQSGNVTKELNKVSFNGAEAKYDLRSWRRSEDSEKMLKGITLTADEIKLLKAELDNLDL